MSAQAGDATLCGNISAEIGARWPERDRALRVGVEAAHLPPSAAKPRALRLLAFAADGKICTACTADAARETFSRRL